jgi:hypothetical protein
MKPFDESQVRRAGDGKFAEKPSALPPTHSVSVLRGQSGWLVAPAEPRIIREHLDPGETVVVGDLLSLVDAEPLWDAEGSDYVGGFVGSVFRTRTGLTTALQNLAEDSPAALTARQLRKACLGFLDRVEGNKTLPSDPDYPVALGEFRAAFAEGVGHLRRLISPEQNDQ